MYLVKKTIASILSGITTVIAPMPIISYNITPNLKWKKEGTEYITVPFTNSTPSTFSSYIKYKQWKHAFAYITVWNHYGEHCGSGQSFLNSPSNKSFTIPFNVTLPQQLLKNMILNGETINFNDSRCTWNYTPDLYSMSNSMLSVSTWKPDDAWNDWASAWGYTMTSKSDILSYLDTNGAYYKSNLSSSAASIYDDCKNKVNSSNFVSTAAVIRAESSWTVNFEYAGKGLCYICDPNAFTDCLSVLVFNPSAFKISAAYNQSTQKINFTTSRISGVNVFDYYFFLYTDPKLMANYCGTSDRYNGIWHESSSGVHEYEWSTKGSGGEYPKVKTTNYEGTWVFNMTDWTASFTYPSWTASISIPKNPLIE